MTYLTNLRAVILEKRGFSVKLAPKMDPVCPPLEDSKSKDRLE